MHIVSRLIESRAVQISGLLLFVGLVGYGAWVCTRPGPAPVIDTEERTVYFPRQESDQSYMLADLRGPLQMDDAGCLRLGGDTEAPLVLWPKSGITVDIVDGKVALVDEKTGDLIAHVGDWIMLGGGSVPKDSRSIFAQRLPEACVDDDNALYFESGPPHTIERIEPDEQLKEIRGWD